MAISKITSDAIDATGFNLDSNTLTIDATNNRVGIGTASPLKELHLHTQVGSTGDVEMLMDTGSGSSAGQDAIINSYRSNADLILKTNNSESMRIDSSGNVGIGTSSPTTFSGFTTVHHKNASGDTIMLGESDGGILSQLISSDGNSAVFFGSRSNHELAITTNDQRRLTVDTSGNLLVGTTTAGISNSLSTSIEASGYNNSRIYVNHSSGGSSNGSLFMGFGYGGSTIGSITQASTSSVAYNTSSDYRLKENVTDITDGIERVKQLNPSRFNFIADADTTVDGFLAHQVSDIVPEAVTGEKDAMMDEEYEVTPAVLDDDGNVVTEAVMGTRSVPSYQGIDQSKLVPLLTAALQEAVAKIETLEAKVTALEDA